MDAEYSPALIEAGVTRSRPSRALLFFFLWLASMAVPMVSYEMAAQQDAAAVGPVAAAD